ncbi:hypothetical protein KUL49_35080 [Alteromonas sp. KUL49]|nr:hypothetical protein KUL49_35080 [Alteromonas sp. KUL49]
MLVCICLSLAVHSEEVSVLTDKWSPYINEEGQASGRAAKNLEVLAYYGDFSVNWEYIPFADAQALLPLHTTTLAYPYFYTEARAAKFYYSEPLYFATLTLFYNRQGSEGNTPDLDDTELRFGKVVGNSYGEAIDSLVSNGSVYPSDVAALGALLSNDIDVLPMAEGVMQSLLEAHFPDRSELILTVGAEQYSSRLGMHVIASKTDTGKALIDRVNKALSRRLALAGEYRYSQSPQVADVDIALVKTAEGYPAILGRFNQKNTQACTLTYEDDVFYTIPMGTRVMVLTWSDKILNPSNTDRLYGNMTEESHVLVLNGPHVGKEVCVKNMHIEVE